MDNAAIAEILRHRIQSGYIGAENFPSVVVALAVLEAVPLLERIAVGLENIQTVLRENARADDDAK
jgi:ABC-type proline/glycine betaine transport system permease subunit